MSKKIFIIACETSGDSHGASLVREILKLKPDIEFHGLGGPQMQSAGVQLLHDMTTFSALGFSDVIRQYGSYKKVFNLALQKVKESKPDLIILIDSPAFNLRFAKKIKKEIPTTYYISPQLWAWGKRRISVVKKVVSKMLVILPFEKEMYDEQGIPCEFVGHPLLDHVNPNEKDKATLKREHGISPDTRAIGLLPGSRASEVTRILPSMLKSAELIQNEIKDVSFFVTRAPNIDDQIYQSILKPYPNLNIQLTSDGIHGTLSMVDFALITSGTATTEAAILGTPFFLFYKASWLTYYIGRMLVKVEFLGLVNLIAEKRIVPEFIQRKMKPKTVAHETRVLFNNPELYQRMKNEFKEVVKRLGQPGASSRAAQSIVHDLDKKI